MKVTVGDQTFTIPQKPRYFNGMWKPKAALNYLKDNHPKLVKQFMQEQRQGDANFHRGVVSFTKR